MSWTTPVTDRTQADVDYARLLNTLKWSDMTAQQKADFNTSLKGSLNTSDLVRICGNINEINTLFSLGMSTISPTYGRYITTQNWTQIRNAMQTIRSRCLAYPDTPQVPYGMTRYAQVNDIERILYDVYAIYQENKNTKRYTGEVYTQDGWLDLI